jgi:hypothetical protein
MCRAGGACAVASIPKESPVAGSKITAGTLVHGSLSPSKSKAREKWLDHREHQPPLRSCRQPLCKEADAISWRYPDRARAIVLEITSHEISDIALAVTNSPARPPSKVGMPGVGTRNGGAKLGNGRSDWKNEPKELGRAASTCALRQPILRSIGFLMRAWRQRWRKQRLNTLRSANRLHRQSH